MPNRDSAGVVIFSDYQGLITSGSYPGTIPTTADKFAVGCIMVNSANGKSYYNSGTSAVPVWTAVADQVTVEALTATADGLTTGLISSGTTFVSATSAAATNALTLPAAAAATIGQQIDIYVGSNGYELLTPASSNNTINTVDSDGTNQLDVAANTLLRCVQVTATGWMCYQVAATTITVVAPDND